MRMSQWRGYVHACTCAGWVSVFTAALGTRRRGQTGVKMHPAENRLRIMQLWKRDESGFGSSMISGGSNHGCQAGVCCAFEEVRPGPAFPRTGGVWSVWPCGQQLLVLWPEASSSRVSSAGTLVT